jgi:hypothetical protein
MNFYMSITMDLLLYCILLNINRHEWLDEKYEGSFVVLS